MTKILRSHFTNPETLFEIGHETVVQLLEPHRAFLRAKGFNLPARSEAATIDLERLAVLLSELDPQFPPELAEAIHLIDQASNPECGDRLHDAVARAGIRITADQNLSPAALAARVWLKDADLLRRSNAEQVFLGRRKFDIFPRGHEGALKPRLGAASLKSLGSHAKQWQIRHRRANVAVPFKLGCLPGEHLIVLRSSGTFCSRGIVTANGEPGRTQFRSLVYSFARIRVAQGELHISAETGPKREMLRRAVGAALYGHEDAWLRVPRFSLGMLREGRQVLCCKDVPGLDNVELRTLGMESPNAFGYVDRVTGWDVYEAMAAKGRSIAEDDDIVFARFEASFTGTPGRKPVILEPGGWSCSLTDEQEAILEVFFDRFRINADDSTLQRPSAPSGMGGNGVAVARATRRRARPSSAPSPAA